MVAWRPRRRGVHGVVCGHIHHVELRDIDGILYANDGDWVESLTALVEHHDGRLEIIDWSTWRPDGFGRFHSPSSGVMVPTAPERVRARAESFDRSAVCEEFLSLHV